MSAGRKALVLTTDSGTTLSWLGHPVRWLALGDDTDGTYAISVGVVPPGEGPPPHRHGFAEGFYIVRGEATFTAGNRSIAVTAGGFIGIGAGTAHRFEATGADELELLLLVAPSGFDRYQIEAGRVVGAKGPCAPATPDELRRMKDLAPRFGIEFDLPADAFEVEPDVVVRHSGEGRAFDIVGDLYTFLAVGDETGGRYCLWHAVVPPGGGPPPHIQTREHEGFYILDGELAFYADGGRVVAGPGTFLNVPPGCLHRFKNESDSPAHQLIFCAPAGIEGLFFEAGRPVADPDAPIPPPSPEDIGRILAVAPKYGVEIRPPDSH